MIGESEMTKNDFETKSLRELCEELEEQGETITSFEVLKDFAIDNINSDNFLLASHICEALCDYAEFYFYDYCMGTLETPTPITSKEDLEHLIDED